MKTIYTKLAELKKEVGKMTKDSKNPFFNSKYFDINQLLEHLEPLLQKNGLIVLQPIINKEVIRKIIELSDKNLRELLFLIEFLIKSLA